MLILTISFCVASFFSLNVYTASSFETKVWFSRLRYLGFSFITPAGVLFFSYILKRWTWLQNKWVSILIFLPGIITTLITFNLFDQNLMVHSYAPYDYLDVSVLTFKNGPWFFVYYPWTNLLTLSVMIMFIHSSIVDKPKRKHIFILSIGVVIGSVIDFSSVIINSSLRWIMLSAGTFSISELAILYVSKKNDLFGLLTPEKEKQAKLLEHLDFQQKLLTLLTHDLSGNIRNQAKIAQSLKKRLQDNHHEILDSLTTSSQASDDLIDNIMRWVKSQDSQFLPQMQTIEVHNLFKNCIRSLQGTFDEQKIEIEIQAISNPFYVKCDAEMMASVLRNLFSNSIKASSQWNKITLQVTEDESETLFTVIDQGVGMTLEKIDSLWDSRAGKQKTNGTGYGVGLLLARHFIELHQGKLEITSIQNQGTQVQFTVPR